MTVSTIPASLSHEVWQKATDAGRTQPIWCWRLRQGDSTVAFGERRSEQQAILAAQSAEKNYGRTLARTS